MYHERYTARAMPSLWTVYCDDPSVAVEVSQWVQALAVTVAPEVVRRPIAAAREAEGAVAVALLRAPTQEDLVGLPGRVPLALLHAPDTLVHLASDLGHPVVTELRPFASLLALATAERPWTASPKGLEPVDRARLSEVLQGPRGPHRFVAADGARVALEGEAGTRVVGEARDVAEALAALVAAEREPRPAMPRVEGVEPQSVLDIILGPPRTLSDPASKAVLARYDVPLPVEELCSSPSRAASEASRIGFPVRVALASPELRIAEHPDLVAERVENAARTRDVFRQLMTLAKSRAPGAPILGVTVSATAASQAALQVRCRAVDDVVITELGFADPHGLASGDRTTTVLPCRAKDLERALGRLAGSSLILEGSAAERRARIDAIGDALLRVAALMHDWRAEIASVELRPLLVLLSGGVEVREAYVTVTDAFQRSLESLAVGG